MRQGDWMCPMCSNVNFARREKCNICQTVRPDIKLEERDGAGGGFMERDLEEELRPRGQSKVDEVDVYDEFGRKKKKFRLRKQG